MLYSKLTHRVLLVTRWLMVKWLLRLTDALRESHEMMLLKEIPYQQSSSAESLMHYEDRF